MYRVPRLSEAVYVGLCHKIGSPTEVRIRREVTDTVEVVRKPVFIMRGHDRMLSGSRREGFRLKTSDFDYMVWLPDHKVICDPSQISLYRIPKNTVLLIECDDLPPGFTRLKLMSPSFDYRIISSLVFMNKNVSISSKVFRDNNLRFIKTGNVPLSTVVPHGPCSTFSLSKDAEADSALCFQSPHWPTSALPWTQRCHEQGWPNRNVVSDILSGGFHVVAIGSTPENELEWRISFSRAEQKLVYSMNHCQFLCYGLFKIFLKEVINCQTNTPILCSYFIKTIVFWVIQTNTSLSWTPDKLLNCFWDSFKLLINMVRIGNCPNFFIPQNNMFRVKVTGSVQTSMFNQLYDLYNKGISCLLFSETIRHFLSIAIINKSLGVCTDESRVIFSTDVEFDKCLFFELTTFYHDIQSLKEFAVYIKQVEKMITEKLTSYQPVIVQCSTSEVLRNTAIFLHRYQKETRNKDYYNAKVTALLKQSCTFGYLSDILYLAMYLYRTRRYEESLNYLHKAQEGMSVPFIMYGNHVNVDMYMYRHYMETETLGTKLRRAVVINLTLQFENIYIDELEIDQFTSMKRGIPALNIPPRVMLHMMLILNHHRLGDIVRSQQSLQDLQTLLLYDDGVDVPLHLRDISWQILGICQQICGDYSGSLRSYHCSLQQEQFHKLQKATFSRIINLASKCSRQDFFGLLNLLAHHFNLSFITDIK